MNLEDIKLSEISQIQKAKYCMISVIVLTEKKKKKEKKTVVIQAGDRKVAV
jgi:hypothetical protein